MALQGWHYKDMALQGYDITRLWYYKAMVLQDYCITRI